MRARGLHTPPTPRTSAGPLGVVVPRTVDADEAAVAVCHRHGAPLLSLGGGTSLAGQCTNTAVVIDWTKYCHRVPDIDVDGRTCTVEPGIVLDVLNNEHLKPYGLRFGPEPAVQFGGHTREEANQSAEEMLAALHDTEHEPDVSFYDDPAREDELWAVREAAWARRPPTCRATATPGRAGRAGKTPPSGRPGAHPWLRAAVHPVLRSCE
jgi:FAD binding domain